MERKYLLLGLCPFCLLPVALSTCTSFLLKRGSFPLPTPLSVQVLQSFSQSCQKLLHLPGETRHCFWVRPGALQVDWKWHWLLSEWSRKQTAYWAQSVVALPSACADCHHLYPQGKHGWQTSVLGNFRACCNIAVCLPEKEQHHLWTRYKCIPDSTHE